MANPLRFLQQVRSETAKISWPSRREVVLTSVMVLVLTGLTALFFSGVDFVIRLGVGQLIGG